MSAGLRSVRRRLRTLRAHIRSLSDALLAARLLAWRLAVAPLKRTVPVERLVRLMASSSGRPASDAPRVIELVDWIYGPRRDTDLGNCLDRSLVLYRFLPRNGSSRRLVLGVRRDSGELEGHAWVIVGERVLGATSSSGAEFVSLVAFDAQGRRVEDAAWSS
jgi:hypothetical protein